MSITRRDVENVALLARLQFSEPEMDRLADELAKIVSYVDHLAEVNTEGVEPMAHAVEVHNVFAADEVGPSLPREAALSNAPRHNERGYLVPPVFGD
jgi:aspartyl-tRNA(Asn)/glutamyl-tRNA(Gln) amidotransferase subunit C